jgi:hypothetical protein
VLKKVPTADAAWGTDPFEAQYLKLYDVTPPPMPPGPTTTRPYAIGHFATINWSQIGDPEGGISGYHLLIGTSSGQSNVFDGVLTGTSQVVSNAYGQTLFARVSAINNAGIEGPASTNSPGIILLDPAGDYDGDGMNNADEDLAGTSPLNQNSVLRILTLANGNLLTWSSVPDKTYRVLATTDLTTNPVPISGVITAAGPTASYLDNAATNSRKFYRINVLP